MKCLVRPDSFLIVACLIVMMGCESRRESETNHNQSRLEVGASTLIQVERIYGASVVRTDSQYVGFMKRRGVIDDSVDVSKYVALASNDSVVALKISINGSSSINKVPDGLAVSELVLDVSQAPWRIIELLNSCSGLAPERLAICGGEVPRQMPSAFSNVKSLLVQKCINVDVTSLTNSFPRLLHCVLDRSKLAFIGFIRESWSVEVLYLDSCFGFRREVLYNYISGLDTLKEFGIDISSVNDLKGMHVVKAQELFLHLLAPLNHVKSLPKLPNVGRLFVFESQFAGESFRRIVAKQLNRRTIVSYGSKMKYE